MMSVNQVWPMEEALVCVLGFETLWKEQDRVLRAFVAGRVVFSALPTGYGKSLCFTLLLDGLVNPSYP